MADAQLGSESIRYAHVFISRVLSQAVKWGWLDGNVAKLASPPTVKRTVVSASQSARVRSDFGGSVKPLPINGCRVCAVSYYRRKTG